MHSSSTQYTAMPFHFTFAVSIDLSQLCVCSTSPFLYDDVVVAVCTQMRAHPL